LTLEHGFIDAVVERLVRLGAKAIVLFGSRARGDWMPWSDYDLLVIGDFHGLRYLDRVRVILDAISDIPINVEPHPYTLDEALNMLDKGHPFIIDALEEGIVFYDSGVLRKLIEKYEELKRKGLRRSETSIILPKE